MIGQRIKLARKKAGLSLRGLADALGGRVTAQAIGKYERDEMTPSSGILIALTQVLGVSLAYLMDTQGIELTGVDFRTKANTTAKDRAQVETTVIEWIERYVQIERVLEHDSAEWKKPPLQNPRIAAIKDAEPLADEIRQLWELGKDPIPNMTELLEEKGLKVLVETLPDRVSGFTCLVKRGGDNAELPVIVVNKKVSLERRRLTLAHELAHRLIDPEELSERDEEKAATLFASSFLMPREHLAREAGRHRHRLGYHELIDLKRMYRVSGAALLVRLNQIGVIHDAALTYAFQGMARTWRTEEPEPLEPSQERGQRERPRRFKRLCYRALAEGLISLPKAAELLRTPIDDVEAGLKGPEQSHADYC
jgi:Zn-dependent peptidase ImmA (M78 family)/transcriptional regulator with XRE-family HTH domain